VGAALPWFSLSPSRIIMTIIGTTAAMITSRHRLRTTATIADSGYFWWPKR
jgi:hypothetical protein